MHRRPRIAGDRRHLPAGSGSAHGRKRAHCVAMRTATDTPDAAPLQPLFAAATPEEIRQAEALRRAIAQRYLAAAARRESDPYWAVGAD